MFRRFTITLLMLACLLQAENKTLYILHTNNTNGTLENCYCPEHPYGSIEKRAAFIETWLEEHPNTIIVDCGDFVALTNRGIKDSLACVAYSYIPYDAILPGDQELTRGKSERNALLQATKAPILNTNISKPRIKGGQEVLIIKRNGIKVAVLGVVGSQAIRYYPEPVRQQIELEKLENRVAEIVKKVTGQVDLVVLLTHQGYDYDLKLAANIQGVDLIIGAHSQTSLKTTQIVNNIMVAQAGKEGYYVGIIKVEFDENNQVVEKSGYLKAMELEMPDHPQVMELIKEYEQKTGNINRRKLK